MEKKLRIVLAQLNLTVGDIEGNLKKHIDAAITARDQLSADVIVYPELSLTGYPPEDLLLRKAFIEATQEAFQKFVASVKDIYCVVSHPYVTDKGLQNTCSLIYNGAILGHYSKQYLPNYGVFDEDRYFVSGNTPCVVNINDIPIGLVICEDAWVPEPIHQAAQHNARIILVPNASPFEVNKYEQRVTTLSNRAKQDHIAILYVNNVGGQDDLVFDGGSMAIDDKGQVCQLAEFFNEVLLPVDVIVTDKQIQIKKAEIKFPTKEEKIYQALVLGTRDYIEKNHFPGVLVGVSGGIDSALTLAIAVDALGKGRVHAILLPSRYTATMSVEDALTLSHNLGVSTQSFSIEPSYKSFQDTLATLFLGKEPDVAEENIQSRCRAIILMALSNKSGCLVLTTGNRSELAVGYCTLYGDMAGGFAVLKDVPKTLVYDLVHYRNQIKPIIPQRIIERPPTAELAPNQKDEDTLPPYPILDQILEYYLNQGWRIEEIIKQGFDAETVIKVVSLIRKNEYKRKQAAVGPRINHKAFGKDRRYPITNGFKG